MSKWDARITKAEKFLEPAHLHGQKVFRRYQDKRDDISGVAQRCNIFYSNVQTIKESLFNSMPKPDVARVQRGDFEDDVSRVAALVVQRGLTYEVNCAHDFYEAISSAIIDRLVPGLGQVWVTFNTETDEEGAVAGTETIGVESVYWEDFLYEPARRWSKVTWVARRVHLSKKEMKGAYGDDVIDRVATGTDHTDTLTPNEINKDKFEIYEVWDKTTKKVYHVCKGMEEPLKEFDDPYQLKGFFPCPRPLIANVDTTSFLPVTDYHLAQDQYLQLDILYGRINLIVEAIKVTGLYDASNASIAKMLNGCENKLIPVDNWAMHAERGGSRGQIDWFPVEQVAAVLQQLYAAFEATKAILFEITGMSDIIRGSSSPYETKGAQEIKAQFASVRLGGYQRDVAIFVRDVMRIMAEMFTQLYSDEKIMKIIGNLSPADTEVLPQVAQVLRDDILSKYKVDVSANSLTQADWAMEKDQRMELVQTVGQMIGQVQQVATQTPELAMLGVQLIKFAIAGYKAGTELEGWIDQQLDAMAQSAMDAKQNPQPPEPSDGEKQAAAEAEKMQMDAQLKQQEAQQRMQLDQQKAEMEIQMKQFEFQHRQQLAELELQLAQAKLQLAVEEGQLKLRAKEATAVISVQSKAAEAEIKRASEKEPKNAV